MINQETMDTLEFYNIIKEVQVRAIGTYSKEQVVKMKPESNIRVVQTMQQETREARIIIDSRQSVPFMGLTQIHRLLEQVKKGMILDPSELIEVADFLRSNRMLQTFFEKNKFQTPLLFQYTNELLDFHEMEDTIYENIQNGRISEVAQPKLRKIRMRLKELETEMNDKLIKFLRHKNNKMMIQDNLIIQKNGYYTIPIKASYKNKVSGTIIEESNKGQTVYVEPTVVSKLNERRRVLLSEEAAEEYQVLATMTGDISQRVIEIGNSIEAVTALDIIFARAKYSREINGVTPLVNKEERIIIKQGKHPFLLEKAVPLDAQLGKEYRGLVITGANAGGKTVVLKTMGLLTLMAMVGLQLPTKEGTEIAVLDHLFVDIGDQQNMENSLSTFSGHIQNIVHILHKISRHTLVLLDEIGSGTEPNEGAGLGIAIMDTMYQKGALVVATTHYGEIKRFAEEHEDFVPAAMAFDKDTLTPEYKLEVGKVGDSQALWIAKKMNMSENVLKKASNYIQDKSYVTEQITFPNENKKQTKLEESLVAEERYEKGDKVWLTEKKQSGLVYQDEGRETLEVYFEKSVIRVPRKRVILKAEANDLYPMGYDRDSLFVDFQTRKQTHDIERGSKKAHKKWLKENKQQKRKE